MNLDGLFDTAERARTFALAGNATITLVSRASGVRFTFRIKCPTDSEGQRDGSIHFVSLLRGTDNENDFSYIGYIRRGVFFHGGTKAKVSIDGASVKAFMWAWKAMQQDIIPEKLEIWHEGHCGRCGRKLTVPSSVAAGLGPECAEKGLS